MSDKSVTKAKLKARPIRGPAPSRAFDQWLTRKLHDVFDTVAQEPLPRELRELVEKLEEKERTTGNDVQFDLPLNGSKT
jgi:hypothetical protein